MGTYSSSYFSYDPAASYMTDTYSYMTTTLSPDYSLYVTIDALDKVIPIDYIRQYDIRDIYLSKEFAEVIEQNITLYPNISITMAADTEINWYVSNAIDGDRGHHTGRSVHFVVGNATVFIYTDINDQQCKTIAIHPISETYIDTTSTTTTTEYPTTSTEYPTTTTEYPTTTTTEIHTTVPPLHIYWPEGGTEYDMLHDGQTVNVYYKSCIHLESRETFRYLRWKIKGAGYNDIITGYSCSFNMYDDSLVHVEVRNEDSSDIQHFTFVKEYLTTTSTSTSTTTEYPTTTTEYPTTTSTSTTTEYPITTTEYPTTTSTTTPYPETTTTTEFITTTTTEPVTSTTTEYPYYIEITDDYVKISQRVLHDMRGRFEI